MSKPVLVVMAPIASYSGYGSHSRDLVRSLISMDKFNIKILPLRWGNTPLNALVPGRDDDILNLIQQDFNLPKQPEISIQISVPNEFQPFAKWNCGITAGIETTACQASWLEGLNRMDLNIVSSEFSKNVFINTKYQVNNSDQTELKLEKPMEILFEGVDTNIYDRQKEVLPSINNELNTIKEDFCFLYVGHWLQGSVGNDRKDVGMLVHTFLNTFKNLENTPALILKTNGATFSISDKEEITKKITNVKKSIGIQNKFPKIYLLHGELTDQEMCSLYNHNKVKAMVTYTKGEGFGRPLLEFSMCAKPIIASAWSGHMDFLDKELSVLLPGQLTQVDESSVNDFIIKESKWFTVDYKYASLIFHEMTTHYNKYLSNAKKLYYSNSNKYSLNDMTRKLSAILNRYVPEFPEEKQLILPNLKNIELPKLKKGI